MIGTRDAGRCCPRLSRPGFTMVELLLVVMIISIVTAITMPSMVRSMRGHQRRSAIRAVMAAGRYARSMAVLQQTPMALVFDLDSALLLVEPRARRLQESAAEGDTPQVERAVALSNGDDGGLEVQPMGRMHTIERRLEPMRLASVEIGSESPVQHGRVEVLYHSNGRCLPYRVRLVDDRDNAVVISVDALATATVDDDALL